MTPRVGWGSKQGGTYRRARATRAQPGCRPVVSHTGHVSSAARDCRRGRRQPNGAIRPLTPDSPRFAGNASTRTAMISDITIVVPAADEEQRISGSLDAIAVARNHLYHRLGDIQVRVLVVLDDCHDATAAIVARHPSVQPVISTARKVGAARRLGTEHALQHGATPETEWLANTDADSRVPPANSPA